MAGNETTEDGHRFIGWRFKPGQRVQLLVPIDRWTRRIVLPIEALIQEGAEWLAHQQRGRRFYRRPVQVAHREQRREGIVEEGSLKPGDVVASALF